jgi:predicted nucleic acid-binding Zn ribbon protein
MATTITAVPLYVYKREDGSTVEIQHSIHDEALTVCPETGQPMERVLQAFGSAQMPPRFHAEGVTSKRSSY